MSEKDASRIFGPLVGATSLISSLAAYTVSSVSSYTTPMQQLYCCSALLLCSAACGQMAYRIQASTFSNLTSSDGTKTEPVYSTPEKKKAIHNPHTKGKPKLTLLRIPSTTRIAKEEVKIRLLLLSKTKS